MWLREGRNSRRERCLYPLPPLRILLESGGRGGAGRTRHICRPRGRRGRRAREEYLFRRPRSSSPLAAVSAFGRGIRKEALYFRLGDGEGEGGGGNADLFLLYHEEKERE